MICLSYLRNKRFLKGIIMDNKAINSFARKWLAEFESDNFNPYIFFEGDIGPEWFGLGFEMDCGNSFSEAYSSSAFNDSDTLEQVIDNISDVKLLGDAIFSQWRYFNHWAMGPCTDDNIRWFKMAFMRLVKITE